MNIPRHSVIESRPGEIKAVSVQFAFEVQFRFLGHVIEFIQMLFEHFDPESFEDLSFIMKLLRRFKEAIMCINT